MARRRLDERQLQEMAMLRDRCLFVIRFLNRSGERGEQARQFEDVIEHSYATQDLRGLRILRRDLDEWSKGLSPDARLELEALLKGALGVDVDAEHTSDMEAVCQIEQRGRIRNEREYRLVTARVEELRDSSADNEAIERLNALLADY